MNHSKHLLSFIAVNPSRRDRAACSSGSGLMSLSDTEQSVFLGFLANGAWQVLAAGIALRTCLRNQGALAPCDCNGNKLFPCLVYA